MSDPEYTPTMRALAEELTFGVVMQDGVEWIGDGDGTRRATLIESALWRALVAHATPQVVEVRHADFDTEAHAASFNEGYEAAMIQGLADDPTLAGDWLAEHDEAVRAEARREVLEQAARVAEDWLSDASNFPWVLREGVFLIERNAAAHTTPEQIRALAGVVDTESDRELAEQGRALASRRDDLIVQGVDPSELAVPLHPDTESNSRQEFADREAALGEVLVALETLGDTPYIRINEDEPEWGDGYHPTLTELVPCSDVARIAETLRAALYPRDEVETTSEETDRG